MYYQIADFTLATSNIEKILEYRGILNYEIAHVEMVLPEPNIDKNIIKWMAYKEYLKVAEVVGSEKAKAAYNIMPERPLWVEATFLFVDSLDGFPGPYIGDLDSEKGRDVIIKLIQTKRFSEINPNAVAISSLAHFSKKNGTQIRHGVSKGTISSIQVGRAGFGWDPIFIPSHCEGTPSTFAQMTRSQKNFYSMRRLAAQAILDQPFLK